jgi:1-deoxy-D-xylulose-5-phosphate synthase
LKPVVAVYSTFMQRAVDQIIHDVSLMGIPMVVGLDRAGLVGGDGPTHQGIYDISLLRPVPGIVLMAPKDENELQHMIHMGAKLDKPVFIRYPKEPGVGVQLDVDFIDVPEGTCEILRRGDDAVILAVGPLVYRALNAAERLARTDGIEATVINARYIKPLDKERILPLCRKIKNVITVEDGVREGGFGSQIRELLSEGDAGDCRILSIGVPEEVVPLASRRELLSLYGLDEEGIYIQVGHFMKNRSSGV